MAIEKSLYEAPKGLESINDSEPDIQIEIEDPEDVTLSIGDLSIDLMPDESDEDFNENLAEQLSESQLQTIADELTSDYEDDVASRKDWIQTYVDGLELLGLKIEERAEPWQGACGVYHPLMSEDRKSTRLNSSH